MQTSPEGNIEFTVVIQNCFFFSMMDKTQAYDFPS